MDTLPLQGKVFVRDLIDGLAVDSFFLVRERIRREKRNGDAFIKLQLGDVTGIVEAVCWECTDELWAGAAPGTVVRVAGAVCLDTRHGQSPTIPALRPAGAGGEEPPPTMGGPR